ncbi:hypothetical protein [Achromobacter arsenitoxydans]|uniref:Uncharacterized protein n=1 Tax=Achromobacter arsenitoxydans SY8 TaxID=477184 RepID=H0F9M1_9BURK|nr:hypothetical protein [Achromobacter arsenitoxydans]EHK65286.1 hypothetical protein KYC_17367 [Achromobacter arsenitoxydans SY8]
MDTVWVSLAGAAFGGIIAAGSAWLTNSGHTRRLRIQLEHDREKLARELRRTCGEDLYQLVDAWQRNVTQYHLVHWRVLAGKLTPDDAHELLRDELKSSPSNLGRIEMLIKVYFPMVEPAYTATLSARGAINDVIFAFERSFKATGKASREHFENLERLQPGYDAAVNQLNKAIIDEIRATR